MTAGGDVLKMLQPEGQWVISGDEYEGITWFDDNIITKEEFEAGFAKYEAWKAEQDATKASAKAALLDRLGITAEEAALLLG